MPKSKRSSALGLTALLLACSLLTASPIFAEQRIIFSSEEVRRILRLSPLPPLPDDPGNEVANNEAAALLGQYLFFDSNLSSSRKLACASCHVPAKAWADGNRTAQGERRGSRNTPSLLNVAYNRWFFWDGRADSLWSQALKPIESYDEMNGDRTAVLHYIRSTNYLYELYQKLFGDLDFLRAPHKVPAHAKPATGSEDNESIQAWKALSEDIRVKINAAFANVGKSIAAFERRLISTNSPFDLFVDGLRSGDIEKQSAVSESAKSGLKIFLGKGRCTLCHIGPTFSNGEFHSLGLAAPTYTSWTDLGRLTGVRGLLRDEFSLTGRYANVRGDGSSLATTFIVESPELAGKFRTPTLRNIAKTAPYMHAGHFANLNDVLHFYSEFKGADVSDHHRESVLTPLRLTAAEIAQVIAFLESLTGEDLATALTRPPLSQ